MNSTQYHTVKVFYNDEHIADLGFDAGLETFTFNYEPNWRAKGFAISPHLPLEGAIASVTVKRFLDNLLPEGEGLEELISFANVSRHNTFALIMTIAHETSGALVFGDRIATSDPLFREIKHDELSKRIDEIDQKNITIWDNKTRLSLAGVQTKLAVLIQGDTFGLGDGSLASTHILKFQTKKFSNIVINEFFCMKMAKKMALYVADVALKYFDRHPVLIVQRFDRMYEDQKVRRIHVLDSCQMLDVSPSYKYERNFGSARDVKEIRDGVSFVRLFELSNRCEAPIVAKKSMLEWALFNLIIGNSDAHGKNFSFFVTNSGIRVAPTYDMLAVMMYDEFENEMAMGYGDEFDLEKITAYDLLLFAKEIDISKRLLSNELKKQCKKIRSLLDDDFLDMSPFSDQERDFIHRLKQKLSKRIEYLNEHAHLMMQIS